MALGTREILLIIRARDEASRAMQSLTRSMGELDAKTKAAATAQVERGRALTSIGVGVGAVGAAGLVMVTKFVEASVEYNRQTALTLTQVDKQKIKLNDLKKVGLDVAKAIPVPFEEIQTSLYDIFSSMDVNLAGAKTLLVSFSKAAVAGQVSLQDASRATIGIMNAYRMSADKVNQVNDVMFQLVRKGVGTYGEFATTIGRAVPSAVRAGQSIQQLAAMMAFLTRNGLSAAMASASAGRALDAISNPKTVDKMDNLGHSIENALGADVIKNIQAMGINLNDLSVKVVDSTGKFRPMNDIMTDLGKTFQKLKLTGPQMAAVLQEIFKGSGGTIQARRFFDVAVKGYQNLNSLTKDMENSSGQLQAAYNIMFKQPASQIQLLKNNWQELKVQLGDALIPALTKVAEAVANVLKWFNNLSPTQKKFIAWTILITSVLLVLVGIILVIAGGIAILAGAAAALGVGLGVLIGIIAAVIAVIAAIIAIVWLVIKYWKPISGFFIGLWNTIKDATVSAWNATVHFLVGVWNAVVDAFMAVWKPIESFVAAVWRNVLAYAIFWWKVISSAVIMQVKIFITSIKIALAVLITIAILLWRAIAAAFQVGWKIVMFFLRPWIAALKAIWDELDKLFGDKVRWLWNMVSTAFKIGWAALVLMFKTGSKIVMAAWDWLWNNVISKLIPTWNRVKTFISTTWNIIKSIWNAGTTAIRHNWDIFWNGIKAVATSVWSGLKTGFNAFWGAIKQGFNAAKTAILAIWNSIKSPMAGPVNFIIDKVWNNGIRSAWNTAVGIVHLGDKYKAPYVPPIKAATGGYISGAGGPTDDKIPAMLSDGEYVINAKQTGKWFHVLKMINSGKMPGFKGGGIVGGITSAFKGISGAWDFLTALFSNPLNAIKKVLSAPLNSLKDITGSQWGQVVAAVPKQMVEMIAKEFVNLFKKFGYGGATGVVAAARSQIGLPYSWGGGGINGPSYGIGRGAGTYGFDCSGLTEYAWYKGAHIDIGGVTTTQWPNSVPIPGPRPGALAFPYGPGVHVMLGSDRPGYVIQAPHTGAFVEEVQRTSGNWRWPAHAKFALGGLARKTVNGYMRGDSDYMYAKFLGLAGDPSNTGRPGYGKFKNPKVYDNGGYLRPGLSMVGSFTGRERVLDPRETAEYERGGTRVNVNVYTQEINPRKHAAELGWEIAQRVN